MLKEGLKNEGRVYMTAVSQLNNVEKKASFEELYDLHFDAVNRYLRYRVTSTWDADDLTAIVFIKALENFHRFRGQAPFAVWLFRIAHNVFVDYTRGKQNRILPGEEIAKATADTGRGPEEELLQDEEIKQLREMLQKLPPDYRDVISLRYAGELKFGQIAEVLEKNEASVRVIHHRALKLLRSWYNSHGR